MKDLSETKRLLRSAAVRAGAGALYYSGALNLLRSGRNHGAEKAQISPFAVLLYHRVNPDNDPFFPAVSVKAFDGQMRYLASHFRVLSLADIIERIRAGREVEPRTIAVTFDDGYRDNYLYAHPILRKYNLPATIFVATAFIGRGRILWNDRVAWAIKHSPKKTASVDFAHGRVTVDLRALQNRLGSFDGIIEQLKRYPDKEKNLLMESVISSLGNAAKEPERVMLDWFELRTLAQEGWDVGSHTHNHVILTRIQKAEAIGELRSSKILLEKELQRPVELFAYPNGKESDFSSRTKRLLTDAGYNAAVTTVSGLNGGETDLFELRRLNPWEEHLPSFAVKTMLKYWKGNSTKSIHELGKDCL